MYDKLFLLSFILLRTQKHFATQVDASFSMY